jgi:hypothetical protein
MTAESSVAERIVNEHDSLKYSLLGPSLTKSGQDNVDQSKVNKASQSEIHYLMRNRYLKSSTMHPKDPSSSTMKKIAIRTLPRKSSESWKRRDS